MKTRHFFGAMTLALASLTLASCSGGGSSDSGFFGALPGEMTQYESEMKALEEKAKDIKTEADKKKLIAESQEIQEKYTTKIEETAKALDGTELKVTDGEFAVAQPITLTFDGFASKKELTPRFKLGGALSVPADFRRPALYDDPAERGADRIGILHPPPPASAQGRRPDAFGREDQKRHVRRRVL